MAIKFLDETDIASSTKLGAVKIGNGISIAEDGTISTAGGATESEWKVLIDHTVTEEEAANNIQWWSTDGTDVNGNNVNAKELLVNFKTFTTDSLKIIFQAYKYNQQNVNYLHSSPTSPIANNSTYAILCRMHDTTNVSGERNIEWAFYKNTNQTYSDIVAQGLKTQTNIINGINMKIYGNETGLQAGSTIKAYWR